MNETQLYNPEITQPLITEITINTLNAGNTRITELTQQLTDRIPREANIHLIESADIVTNIMQGLGYGLLAGLIFALTMVGANQAMSIWKTT